MWHSPLIVKEKIVNYIVSGFFSPSKLSLHVVIFMSTCTGRVMGQ